LPGAPRFPSCPQVSQPGLLWWPGAAAARAGTRRCRRHRQGAGPGQHAPPKRSRRSSPAVPAVT